MEITHLGHSTLLVEAAGTRLLIDPGAFTPGWEDLRDLDAVLVTHAHPDHVDPAEGRLESVVAGNPGARLLAEPQTAGTDRWADTAFEAVEAGTSVTLGGLTVRAVGGEHAVIHEDIPRIGNVGYVITADDEPVLFHPGDAYAEAPDGVDVLALPLTAPWAALKETVEFVRRVAPRRLVPIHDAIVNEAGRGLYLRQVDALGPDATEVVDLRGAGARTFST